MVFKVMSKPVAEEYSKRSDINKCAIISITDPNGFPATFANNPEIKDILRLEFYDADRKYDDLDRVIEEDDARKILDFVNKNIDSVDEIIVHCEGGVSRSAGVAAALMYIYNDGDDSPIFESFNYCPNMLCYRTVIETADLMYNEKEADEKEQKNIKLWTAKQEEELQEKLDSIGDLVNKYQDPKFFEESEIF